MQSWRVGVRMILDNHYAVVFRPTRKILDGHITLNGQQTNSILNQKQWDDLNRYTSEGHFVILEAWDITKGKCVSN